MHRDCSLSLKGGGGGGGRNLFNLGNSSKSFFETKGSEFDKPTQDF